MVPSSWFLDGQEREQLAADSLQLTAKRAMNDERGICGREWE